MRLSTDNRAQASEKFPLWIIVVGLVIVVGSNAAGVPTANGPLADVVVQPGGHGRLVLLGVAVTGGAVGAFVSHLFRRVSDRMDCETHG